MTRPDPQSAKRPARRGAAGAVGVRLPLIALAAIIAAVIAVAAAGPVHVAGIVIDSESAGLAAAAALLVVAAIRARSDFGRIRRVTGALHRAGARDFTQPAALAGTDAIAELGRAADATAHSLGLQIAVLQAVSRIEHAIAAGVEPAPLIDIAAPCLLLAGDATAGVVGLLEPGDDDPMAFHGLNAVAAAHGEPIERVRAPAAAGWRDALARQPVEGAASPPIPAAILARLGDRAADARWLLLPIGPADAPRGLVALVRDRDLPLDAERLGWLRELAAALDAALDAMAEHRSRAAIAHLDRLTGLPNRASLAASLGSELALAHRNRSRIGVLLLDLDRFKQANDALGQAVGDELLRRAAERIRGAIRDDDLIARYGDDEFAIVVGGLASGADSGRWARELIRELSRPHDIAGETIYVGASVGIAIFPDDGLEADELLKKAETALQRAKDDGRSRFAYYEDSMNIETRRRVARDRELRQAIERGEFVLHYQPQLDLRSGRVATVEALLRWPHPELGLLRPDAFIRFAEETGLVDALGSWVLREACLQFRRWRAAGVAVPRIAINVPIEQIRRSNFVRSVEEALRGAGMQRDQLEIEITESMFQRGGKAAMNAITTLSHSGVVFTIDAFGSGIASFGWLKTVQAKVLKLDQGFIADVATSTDAGMIVAAVIKMAHSLRKEVVAEGVERREQLEFLKAIGCARAQGYLISRPLDAEGLARFVAARGGSEEPELADLADEPAPAGVDLTPPPDEWLTVPFGG